MENSKSDHFFDLKNFEHKELFNDCKYIWDVISRIEPYLKAKKLGKINSAIPNAVFLENENLISIGSNCIIEKGSYIKGPCIIGDNCQIRHGAYIRGNFICGNGCVIGHCSEVKNSIFLNFVHAAHFAYVGDSILGNKVNLGAGVKCANFRLDGKEIIVKSIKTNLIKLGAIIGDGTQIGCNAVLSPATFICKNTFCYPCSHVKGFI